MKIKGLPGEFAFKALLKTDIEGWEITWGRFFDLEELNQHVAKLEQDRSFKIQSKWPVEVHEDGSVYVPSTEELDETN